VGLNVPHRIVECHGGAVDLTSEPGSLRFAVTLSAEAGR
jgi:nitrogen-specific signal transduction histidine kinase